MMTFPDELYFNDVTKINFILNDYQDYLDVKELFPNLKVSTWGGKGEEALFGDAGILGIDKKSAILQLQKYLNIPISSTVAFGDSEVDIPMFECANDSVAMGEARLAAKEAATFVTDDVEKNGLYNAFEKLNLI